MAVKPCDELFDYDHLPNSGAQKQKPKPNIFREEREVSKRNSLFFMHGVDAG